MLTGDRKEVANKIKACRDMLNNYKKKIMDVDETWFEANVSGILSIVVHIVIWTLPIYGIVVDATTDNKVAAIATGVAETLGLFVKNPVSSIVASVTSNLS